MSSSHRHVRNTWNKARNSLNFAHGTVWFHTERTPKESDESKNYQGRGEERSEVRPFQQSVVIPLDEFGTLFADPDEVIAEMEAAERKVINGWNEKNLGEGMRNRRSTFQEHVPLVRKRFTRHGREEKVRILLTITSYGYTKANQDEDSPDPIERKDLTVQIKHLDSLQESKKEDKSAVYDGLPIPSFGYNCQMEHWMNLLDSANFRGFCADAALIVQSILSSKKKDAAVQDQRKRAQKTGSGKQQQAKKNKNDDDDVDTKGETDIDDDEEEEDGGAAEVQASQTTE